MVQYGEVPLLKKGLCPVGLTNMCFHEDPQGYSAAGYVYTVSIVWDVVTAASLCCSYEQQRL